MSFATRGAMEVAPKPHAIEEIHWADKPVERVSG